MNQETTEQTEVAEAEAEGLLDRYDELFDADGVPKDGTEDLLSDDDTPESSTEDTADDAENTDTPEDVAEQQEDTEASDEHSAESEATDDNYDAFDAETERLKEEMAADPHPGMKFSELREELKKERAENQRLKTEGVNTEEMQKLKLQAERAEKLESELKELQHHMHVVDFQTTPEYKQQVEQPINDVKALAETLEKSHSIEPGTIYRAVTLNDESMQNSAIENIVDEHGLSQRDAMRLYTMADDILKVNAHAEHLKSQASERLKELNEMQVSEQAYYTERRQKELTDKINATLDRFQGKLPGFVNDDGSPNDAWKSLQDVARQSDLSNIEDQAHAIFAANALPHVLDEVSKLSAQLKEKNLLLSRYTKAKPSADISPTPKEKVSDDNATFLERLDSMRF